MNTQFASPLGLVKARIAAACTAANRRTDSVALLAVSKTFPSDAVRAVAGLGQVAFGENYIQEGVEKITALRDVRVNAQALQWHCIGPIQSNKTRLVAEHFDWVHTVDRLKIAQRLSEQRPAHLAPLQVCVQVNVAAVANKSGVEADAAFALARELAVLPSLQLRGLMCIPDPVHQADGALDMQAMQALFKSVRDLHEGIGRQLGGPQTWDTLSMGMSTDLEAAIASGSTLVRVGTAIFGNRGTPA